MSAAHRLLVAAPGQALFEWLHAEAIREPFAGRMVRPESCLPEDVDARLRNDEIDALVVRTGYSNELAPAIRRWKNLRPSLEVLLLFETLPETREIVELMRSGAYDVLDIAPGPALRDAVGGLVQRLDESRIGDLERRQARQSLTALGLIGDSVEMQNLAVEVQNAARLTLPVLVTGPSGAGKTLAAHAIHALGPRATRPLMTIDCAALTPPLLDQALARGATAEAASRGALLLRSVHEASPTAQSELMRLLDSADARVIATSPRRLDERTEARTFRPDLAYRLGVLTVDVPPLRRHPGDIPALAAYFLSRHTRPMTLSDGAAAVLGRYDWPGNVREFKHAIDQAAAACAGEAIEPPHLPERVSAPPRPIDESPAPRDLDLARMEEQAILRALHITGFDKSKAARLLGIGKTTMYRKLKALAERARRAE